MARRRRIRLARINFLSLVPRGANQLETIYKDDGAFSTEMLVKDFDEELGELTAAVYVPEMRDSQGDIAGVEVIKDAMYEAAKTGFNVDIRHDEKALPKQDVYVAQSFIIQKGDPRFADMKNYKGDPVDPAGGWGVILKIENKELRAKYRNGDWRGVSMGGLALVEHEKSEDPTDKNGEPAMTISLADMKEALKESAAATATAVTAGLTTVLKEAGLIVEKKASDDKPKPKGKPAPVFSGEPTDLNMRKHAAKVKKHQATNELDWSDHEAVTEARRLVKEADDELAEIAEEEKAEKEGEEGEKEGQEGQEDISPAAKARISELQKEITKLSKGSNQRSNGAPSGRGSDKNKPKATIEGIAKADKEDEAGYDLEGELAAGSAMASFVNGG